MSATTRTSRPSSVRSTRGSPTTSRLDSGQESSSSSQWHLTIHPMLLPSLPEGRVVYRGLGGMVLDEEVLFRRVRRGCHGGVELGFLSTAASREVAVQYSGARPRHYLRDRRRPGTAGGGVGHSCSRARARERVERVGGEESERLASATQIGGILLSEMLETPAFKKIIPFVACLLFM